MQPSKIGGHYPGQISARPYKAQRPFLNEVIELGLVLIFFGNGLGYPDVGRNEHIPRNHVAAPVQSGKPLPLLSRLVTC
jgi:hypothetical protein